MAADGALDSLSELIEILSANETRIEQILERARYLRTLREAGLDWSKIVEGEQRPLIVELLTANVEGLHEASSRFRRAQARALHSEGMPIERIAEHFGVSRQRISALLKAPEPEPGSFGSYRRTR